MAEFRKSVHVSKFGPQFCFYQIEKKTPVFWGLFSIWLYIKNISKKEYLSPFPAEFLL